ncbi:MAG: hypothetical protein KKF48_03900 [Nanoarchaeota archaeon]|nr:hypothetical protein [Nanoarchaeota archaeon]MBU1028161.1 hypothetical protein [Nanoarchaeota archaeon]
MKIPKFNVGQKVETNLNYAKHIKKVNKNRELAGDNSRLPEYHTGIIKKIRKDLLSADFSVIFQSETSGELIYTSEDFIQDYRKIKKNPNLWQITNTTIEDILK